MPIQERWVMENADRLDVNVIMVVGGFFDRLSGEAPLAPRWVTDRGLEWLYLSLHRPRRLVERYMVENTLFLSRILAARFRVAFGGAAPPGGRCGIMCGIVGVATRNSRPAPDLVVRMRETMRHRGDRKSTRLHSSH